MQFNLRLAVHLQAIVFIYRIAKVIKNPQKPDGFKKKDLQFLNCLFFSLYLPCFIKKGLSVCYSMAFQNSS